VEINAIAGVEHGRNACFSSNSDLGLIQFLLQNGSEVNAQAGIKGGLTALLGSAIQGHTKFPTMLLEAGAEVNAEPASIKGRIALGGAAGHGHLDIMQMILNAGAKSEELGAAGFGTVV
jgi:ankyrin repeat protein